MGIAPQANSGSTLLQQGPERRFDSCSGDGGGGGRCAVAGPSLVLVGVDDISRSVAASQDPSGSAGVRAALEGVPPGLPVLLAAHNPAHARAAARVRCWRGVASEACPRTHNLVWRFVCDQSGGLPQYEKHYSNV